MAQLRALAVEYEVPTPESVQQTAEKVHLSQLQTEIKVRLTKKAQSSGEITAYTYTLLWEISQPCY